MIKIFLIIKKKHILKRNTSDIVKSKKILLLQFTPLTTITFLYMISRFVLSIVLISNMNRLMSIHGRGILLTSSLFISTKSSSFKTSSSQSKASVSSESFSNNALLQQTGLPLFQKIEPSQVVPAIEKQLEDLNRNFISFETLLKNPQLGEAWVKKRIEYDYEMVVEHLEKIQAPLTYSWGCVGHLMGVKNSPELRTAHETMQPLVVQVYQKIGQSQALFKALKALQERKSVWETLDEPQKRIVSSSIRQMEAAGVGLSDTQRPLFNKLQLEAAELSSKFNNNVLDSTKAFKLRLSESSDVEGLPESAKALAAKQAKMDGDEGATPESGPWLVTLDMPSYLPAMQHLKSRAFREKLYRAFVARASANEFDNAPIILRIMQIKQEMAKMLGYSNYAELSLSKKMAKDVGSVAKLIEMLRDQSFGVAQADLQNLKEYAKSKGFVGDMELWDGNVIIFI